MKDSKQKFSKKGCLIIVVIIGLFTWALTRQSVDDNAADSNEVSKIETPEDMLLRDLSAWDGSLKPLVDVVKESMHDPSSYEHAKTTYMQTPVDSTDFLITMEYRGKNAFGGVVKNTVKGIYNVKTKEIRNIKRSK